MKTLKFFAFSFAVFLLSSALLTSCDVDAEPSDMVDQNRIFADHELFYNSNQDITYARITFRFGNGTEGTPLELAGGSYAVFDGDTLQQTRNPVTNTTFYEKQISGPVLSGTFSWVDANGMQYDNTITYKTIDYPDSLVQVIDRTQSVEIKWKGDPLAANEQVNLVLDGINGFNETITVQNNVGATSVILPLNQLTGIDPGQGQYIMDREFKPELVQATSAGGRMIARYRAKNQPVTVQ
ncbi:MAG: hypothetical protein AAGI38_13065 [Bacteroidota bacterium]